LIKGLKQRWESLKSGKPGKRFQDEYDKRNDENTSRARKIGMLVAGAAVLVAGIILMPAPGPGILIVAIGAAMLSQESKLAARILDGAEVKGRALIQWALGVWKAAPMAGKIAIAVVALLLTAGALYLAYRIMFQ
jgi:uncharacterized protein (TIGR02611 family)